ncbi:hypothetical protein EJ07DRAFT_142871 [Lizonia empirigonia]|nr:hypothetical protein EJ07DRAFT_142871 [Lizonia empirigonia]
MPNIQIVLAGIAKLPEGSPLVVALVGATTGIGSYTAKAWAATFANHGSKLRVYIVGRNATRAEALLKHCRETSPGSDWQFIQATDLSLMSEVDSVSQRIIHQEELSPFLGGPARLDALYLSQAQSPVQKSPDSIKSGPPPIGTPPAGTYGMTSVRRNATFMKTFFFEELAEKHAGRISFVHIYPGLVDGPTFYSNVNPVWVRIVWCVLKLLLRWYMTSPELGGGAYAVGQRGDENRSASWAKVRKGDTGTRIWNHTMEAITACTSSK